MINGEKSKAEPAARLNEVELRSVELFREGAKVLGLPKSIGEIYGVMYISRGPSSLDDLVTRLEISKGSASQGINFLRQLGAVREVSQPAERRMRYEAGVELKSLISGFIRAEIRPHLDSTTSQVEHLKLAAAETNDPEDREFYEERAERLRRWTKRARTVLPLIQTVMGG